MRKHDSKIKYNPSGVYDGCMLVLIEVQKLKLFLLM